MPLFGDQLISPFLKRTHSLSHKFRGTERLRQKNRFTLWIQQTDIEGILFLETDPTGLFFYLLIIHGLLLLKGLRRRDEAYSTADLLHKGLCDLSCLFSSMKQNILYLLGLRHLFMVALTHWRDMCVEQLKKLVLGRPPPQPGAQLSSKIGTLPGSSKRLVYGE